MTQHEPDEAVALSVLPLLHRGQDALRTRIALLPKALRPIGGQNMLVVTLADFAANAELCFRHVVQNGTPMHILCDDGSICALLEQRITHW